LNNVSLTNLTYVDVCIGTRPFFLSTHSNYILDDTETLKTATLAPAPKTRKKKLVL
jgi:hypothetical protein